MSAGNIIGATGFGIAGIGSMVNGFVQAGAIKDQAKYQNEIAKLEEQRINYQATQVIKDAQFEVNAIHSAGNQLVGRQRAEYAAGNIDVNVGTPSDIQNETRFISRLDAQQARYNAWRQALGYKDAALQPIYRAQAQGIAARYASASSINAGVTQGAATLLTGGYDIYKNWGT